MDFKTLVITALAFYVATIKAANVPSNGPMEPAGQPKFDQVDWQLSKAMGIDKKYENVVVSPISLRVVLGLLMDASNGTTSNEIASFLKIDKQHLTDKTKIREHFKYLITSLNKPYSFELTSDVVTRIFADKTASVNENFLKVINETYATQMEKVDFTQVSELIQKINKWAEGATHGHVSDLLSESDTDSSAVMLLINVIFFNGLWTNPFVEKDTTTESFYLNENQFIKVPMMKAQHELLYAQTFDGDIQMLRMPYQGGSFAMYFVLPQTRSGLNSIIENINPARIHSLMKTMTMATVNVTLPRFSFSYNTGLKPVLQKFGMNTMFTLEADFSNMENNSSNLFVSNILQKAGIEVNEKGSTAFASTVAEVQNKFGGDAPVVFKADRPFVFFIEEEKTRTIVFIGKLSNPDFSKTVLTETNLEPEDRFGQNDVSINKEEKKRLLLEAKQLTRFDTDLLETIGYHDHRKNIVLSPASIKSVLGLLLHGASGNTATELQLTLHLSDNQTRAEEQLLRVHMELMLMLQKLNVKTAIGMFFANNLQPKKEFENYAVTQYFSSIDSINTRDSNASSKKINEWIKKKTGGLITNVINPGFIDPNTKLILVNAMHFKSNWLFRFPKEATRPQKFYKSETETKCVQMMSFIETLKHGYSTELQADVFQIPFQNQKYTFAVILPKKRNSLRKLLHDLKYSSVVELLNDQDATEVTLSMPKFIAEFETDLTDRMKELRTYDIFSEKANLSNIITGDRNLRVNAMVHKAFIEVDEDGAQAGAATVSSVVPLTSQGENVRINMDHPFLFFIYNKKSKTILFEGLINDPLEANQLECESAENIKPIATILDDIYNLDVRKKQQEYYNKFINTTPESTAKTNMAKINNRYGAQTDNDPTAIHPNYPQNSNSLLDNVKPQNSYSVPKIANKNSQTVQENRNTFGIQNKTSPTLVPIEINQKINFPTE